VRVSRRGRARRTASPAQASRRPCWRPGPQHPDHTIAHAGRATSSSQRTCELTLAAARHAMSPLPQPSVARPLEITAGAPGNVASAARVGSCSNSHFGPDSTRLDSFRNSGPLDGAISMRGARSQGSRIASNYHNENCCGSWQSVAPRSGVGYAFLSRPVLA
jgi:hypothetical protein